MVRLEEIFSRINYLKSEEKINKEDEASLNRYFSIDYEITEENQYYHHDDREVIWILLHLKMINHVMMTYQIRVIDFSSINVDYSLSDYIDIDEAKRIFSIALNKYLSNDNNLFLDIKKTYEKNYIKKKEEFKKSFIKKLNNIYKDIEKSDLIADQQKVIIQPILHVYKDHCSFLLKLGRDKLYSVPSINRFLSCVKNKSEYKYGKSLEFIHDISIFDEKGQKFIKLLLNNPEYYVKEGSIDKNTFYNILKIYQDGYIDIYLSNDKPSFASSFLVSLAPVEFKIKIDKDYVLSLSSLPSKSFVVFNQFIIDLDKKEIMMVNMDKEMNNLYSLISSSEYPCIEDNVDDFKYSFILKNPDIFEIDPSIKDDFILNQLEIRAYFDFDKDKNIFLE